MKYTLKGNIVEAFKIGIDPIPDWFMDMVTTNEAILHANSTEGIWATVRIDGKWEPTFTGCYIYRTSNNRIRTTSDKFFEEHFTPICESKPKEPVNMTEPVDPEKERLDALDEYYTSMAREIKLVHDCLIKAGFHPNDAFELLMKLMENPVKPIERKSKSDIIKEWNKRTAERKERLEK